MNKLHIASLLLVCFSCNHKQNDSLIGNKYGATIELVKKTLNIDIDDTMLNTYNLTTSVCHKGKDNYILANNYQTHTIDIFSINDSVISHIFLDTEGSNGISERIEGLHANTLDSIWLATTSNIVLIDSGGRVLSRYSLLERDDAEIVFIMTNFSICSSKMYFNKKRNALFYLVMSMHDDKSQFFVEELSLTDNTQKKYLLSPHVEKDLRNNYGWKQCPNITFTESKIVYNYPIESNIYAIDIETNTHNSYGGKSQFTKNEVRTLQSPYDFEQGNRHYCENVHFFELNHDATNDIYYRLHLNEIAHDATQEFETLFNQKEIYLTIFNNQFEIIHETKLNDQTYNYRNAWGITNDGFFMMKSNLYYNDINHEQLQLDIFNIQWQ